MSRTVLEVYLSERLQSAKGLGWPMPEQEVGKWVEIANASRETRPTPAAPEANLPARFFA
ncbi:MAG: hypothetical protein KJ558_00035 [Gammaproteobacteria bacterium]|nr:hypothetical protein [Gammaproteobacteria bacterium]MBU1653238.1 hypothetical protein [Gammaproteobacteria bacterium]MBU1961042.1 hypothetical protein [Gammaproteobacteria bacterium]